MSDGLSDAEKAAIIGGVVGGAAVIGGVIYLAYLFRDKDIRIRVRLLYEDVETGGLRPVPGGAAVRVLDHDGASTPFEMGKTFVLADGVIDTTVSDDGTREIKPDIMFEVTVPAAPPAPGLISWPAPGLAGRQGRRDPMVGGVSVANVAITAGTLSAAVSARNTEERRILSNWHVLSPVPPAPAAPAVPAAPAASNVVQAGPADGGVHRPTLSANWSAIVSETTRERPSGWTRPSPGSTQPGRRWVAVRPSITSPSPDCSWTTKPRREQPADPQRACRAGS